MTDAIFDGAIFDGNGIFDTGIAGEPEPPTPPPTPPVVSTHKRADPAYFTVATRFGFARFGVYLPVFENDLIPALVNVQVTSSETDAAYFGGARFGHARFGVYVPLFEVIKENLRKKT